MVKVLIIADDFTGALDTGIQFAKYGIETQIITDWKLLRASISDTAEVVVVDSETRALSSEKAYEIVKSITGEAVSLHAATIFKKTDSALRGNVGAEFQAVLDGTNENQIYFIPAFPDINRITKMGTHYIGGELLENSVFGRDPFEPVKISFIPELLAKQCACRIEVVKRTDQLPRRIDTEKTIYVFDAEYKEDIEERTNELKRSNQLKLLAGCAGFAEFLPKALELEMGTADHVKKSKGLYVACGSLSPITKKQVEYMELRGGVRVNLTPEQKVNKEYYKSEKGILFLEQLSDLCKRNPFIIVDTFDLEDKAATVEYAEKYGISKDEIRYCVSECHGKIIKALLEKGMNYTIMLTGGDTLMGVMKILEGAHLNPVCEIERGVVVSKLDWREKELQIITKSGGFGYEHTIFNIANEIFES